MANITVTLLTSKKTRITVDEYNTTVVAQAGGYNVIEGENDATDIEVQYPDAYAFDVCSVKMINARGEAITHVFDKAEEVASNKKSFTIPDTMTVAGNLRLVFMSIRDGVRAVWAPVIVPIMATGVNYKRVVYPEEDMLERALENIRASADAVERINQSYLQGKLNGRDATIESVSATYTDNPERGSEVEVEATGEPTNRSLLFNFINMRGRKGISIYAGYTYSTESSTRDIIRVENYHNLIDQCPPEPGDYVLVTENDPTYSTEVPDVGDIYEIIEVVSLVRPSFTMYDCRVDLQDKKGSLKINNVFEGEDLVSPISVQKIKNLFNKNQ